MIIAADLGNTRLKLGLFEAGQLIDVLFLPYTDLADGLQRHPRWEEIRTQTQYLGMASVKKVDMATALLEHFRWLAPDQVIQITHQSRFPIENAYRTPHTLGMDRLCAAAGAYAQVGKGPLLVIDAGTALTYEFVDAEGRYQGGGITPSLTGVFIDADVALVRSRSWTWTLLGGAGGRVHPASTGVGIAAGTALEVRSGSWRAGTKIEARRRTGGFLSSETAGVSSVMTRGDEPAAHFFIWSTLSIVARSGKMKNSTLRLRFGSPDSCAQVSP